MLPKYENIQDKGVVTIIGVSNSYLTWPYKQTDEKRKLLPLRVF